MRIMVLSVLFLLVGAHVVAADQQPTEADFRKLLGFGPTVHMEYRDLACKPVSYGEFAAGMKQSGAHADADRAADGSAITLTVRIRGTSACPAPYPPITSLPSFDLRDLSGKRVTDKGQRGKPTLISFFFARCVPCIREVGPINKFAAATPNMNFLAVTFDEPDVARAFVKQFDLRWRVIPDARDFIERVRVKQYPLMALFDANGHLLGMKKGGARDELEAANVEPQLRRWVEGLLMGTGL